MLTSLATAAAHAETVEISTICGAKPAVIALIDGYGDSTWRKITRAEFEDEASKCKNITKILYADAGGDQQKWNSDINSMVAQGANVIVSFVDFGDAMRPGYRKATNAGVTVVPYLNKVAGEPGKDYAANVVHDLVKAAQMWADWIGENTKKGGVVFLGGTPGAPTSQTFFDAVKARFKEKYPDVYLLNDDYLVTNWNPLDAQKAVTGAIAKYGDKISAVVADYGVSALATVKAYERANLPIPPIATDASNNELICRYLDAKKSGNGFQLFSVDGTTSTARIALRRGLSIYEGTSDPEGLVVELPVYVDSFKGVDPKCDPSAPVDADLSSRLPPEKLNALFKK